MYRVRTENDDRHLLLNEHGDLVGVFADEENAVEAAAGMNLLLRIREECPGFLDDTPVSGGDLVDLVNRTVEFYTLPDAPTPGDDPEWYARTRRSP